jgi:3-oxoacyl-(acyl-carrier-protein) synthase
MQDIFKKREIWITGLGIVSSIGKNLDECLDSLRKDQTGIEEIKYLDTVHKNNFVAGEVKLSNEELSFLTGTEEDLPRTTLLAILAAREAIQSANLSNLTVNKTGIILGTTVGGMDKTERLYPLCGDPSEYISSHHCGFTTSYLAKYFGIRNYTNTISTACSSGANAIMLGAKLIHHGLLDVVIAGGSDALSVFTLNGFRSLMILDPNPCRPFSDDRKGLNLGEGAGFVILESKEHAIKRNVSAYCRISGFGNSNDAFHQTASSADGRGAFKAMSEAVTYAGITPGDIDYINVHGTGTDNNDLTEGIAIKRFFYQNIPAFSSTKSFTGHCLGAAGAIEAVFSALAIQNNEVYANLRFNTPIAEVGLIPVRAFSGRKVTHVLSNSFGFGGCDTSLLFSGIN